MNKMMYNNIERDRKN